MQAKLISPTLSSRLLISDGDIPIFCAEASITSTVKVRRLNFCEVLFNSSISSMPSIVYKSYLDANVWFFFDIPLNFGVK